MRCHGNEMVGEKTSTILILSVVLRNINQKY